jgi:outer membrane biogenesis lipoprotein LolB
MKRVLIACAFFLLAGCGVETATTAATAGAIKKQEIEQGRKTMDQATGRIAGSMDQAQERLQRADK